MGRNHHPPSSPHPERHAKRAPQGVGRKSDDALTNALSRSSSPRVDFRNVGGVMKDGVRRDKFVVRSAAHAVVAWIIATPANPIFFAAFWFSTSGYRAESDFIRIQTEIAAPFGAGLILAMILWRRGGTSWEVTASIFFFPLFGMIAGAFAIPLLAGGPYSALPRLIISAILWLPASLWALLIVRVIAFRREKPADVPAL